MYTEKTLLDACHNTLIIENSIQYILEVIPSIHYFNNGYIIIFFLYDEFYFLNIVRIQYHY